MVGHQTPHRVAAPEGELGTGKFYEERRRENLFAFDPKPVVLTMCPSESLSNHYFNVMAVSGYCGFWSAIHGYVAGMPYIQNHVKGPKWIHFMVGLPPLLMYSAAGASLGGYAFHKAAEPGFDEIFGYPSCSWCCH